MRILHTMLRVGDLERSLHFYTEVLGMRLLRRNDYPDGKFTLAFVGYGDESDTRGARTDPQLGREQVRARQRLRPHRASRSTTPTRPARK